MAMALSGLQAGTTLVPNGCSARYLWTWRSSTGSSVVQTTLTLNFCISPWARNSSFWSFSVHSS